MEFTCQGVWQGVDYLHSVGVAHGDIKPDNLLLGADGRVRICDFGSAQLASPGECVLRTVGTPAFFTPEMCRGGPFSARAADLWALGVCLYIFVFGAALSLSCCCSLFHPLSTSRLTPFWACSLAAHIRSVRR